MSIIFRLTSHTELDGLLPPFVELLREAVNGGAGLGFLPPLTHDESWDYWLSVRPELQAGSRLLLAAFTGGRLVGSGQLMFPTWTNGPHRVEIQKVFVAAAVRGRGVGRSLMTALHDTARQRGRSLVLLNARRGGHAERFYRRLGLANPGFRASRSTQATGAWRQRIPGFALRAQPRLLLDPGYACSCSSRYHSITLTIINRLSSTSSRESAAPLAGFASSAEAACASRFPSTRIVSR